ncbi:DUF4012 domain-containing protein [Olsenella uli]|uniref:DUF4012 domain-containing protein n=1 Tax=Olsenella uli TaxID=133926 RepID=UPI00195A05C7|nr:DUF4012 domain-containing protein [Olsenella uli]MBM6676700.1 DUF4012 domain-containing protein [Olsenella uli]
MAAHFSPEHSKKASDDSVATSDVGHSREDVEFYTAARKGGKGGGPSRGKKIGIVVGIVLAVLLVVGGTCGVLLYNSAMSVKSQAQELMDQAGPLKEALKNGDAEALDEAVGTVQERMASINAEVHSPLWGLASMLPVVGEDIQSVQKLGDAGAALVDDALVPIADSVSGTGLSDLMQDGTINVELIQSISDAVSSSLPTIEESVDTIANLPEAHIPQLAEVLDKVQGPVSEAQELVGQAKPILELLPQMLGSDGQTRTYLVLAQNNSEVRSTGGMPGSWGTISITDGAISMGEFTTVVNQEGFNVPVLDEELNHIGWTLGTNAAQVTYTPNFVRTGEIASEYWRQAGLGDVDGVIAIDPVFLQRLLGLTGGFTADDGTTIDGSNAASVLLSDTYWKFGNDATAQDAYFGSVAALAFKNIMGNLGNAGMTDLMDVIEQSAKDGRLLVWMANEDEENVMRTLGISGEMGSDPTDPQLGVYLNDATWSKIDWYASCYTQIGEGVANDDGTTSYQVTTTLTNTLTPDEALMAPKYVTGYNPQKSEISDMLTYVYFFAPAGGSISNMSVEGSGSCGAFTNATGYGLPMSYALTSLTSGESVTFTYTVTTSAEAGSALTLRTTPLAQESLMQALIA